MTEEKPDRQSREDMKRSFEKLKKLKEEKDAKKAGGNGKAFKEEVEPERQSRVDMGRSFEKLENLKKESDARKAVGNRKAFTEQISKEKKASDGMLLDVEEAKSAVKARERRDPTGGMSYAEYKAKRDAAMNRPNWVKWVSIPISLAFIVLVGYGLYYGLFLYEEPGDIKVGSSAFYYPVFKWDKAGVYTALEMIEMASPSDYYMVDANVKTVRLYPQFGYNYGKQDSEEGYQNKTVYIMKGFPCPTDCDNKYTGSDLIRAAVIISEACLSMQHNMGQPVSKDQCRQRGYSFVTSMGPVLLPEYNASKYAFVGSAGPYADMIQGETISEMLK